MSPASSEPARSTPSGLATMSPAMSDLRSYPAYLFRLLKPCIRQRVWEIGVGHGLYTGWLLDRGALVLGTDIDTECLAQLAAKYSAEPRLQLAQVDLSNESSVRAIAGFAADSIICMNVMEHIENDIDALAWIRQSCAAGATLGLIVPAHLWLFGRMDTEAGHFRRYTRRSLERSLIAAGWHVRRLRYVNLAGAAGWWYHNRWRKQAGLADRTVNRQMRQADRWLPIAARLTDPLFAHVCGLSVVAHAQS